MRGWIERGGLALACAMIMLAALVAAGGESRAAGRVALVIGNSNYQSAGLLRNPANDARAVGAALARLDFDVMLATDLGKSAFQTTLADFAEKSEGADLALIYYAGHAMELKGSNFLIPTDAKLSSDSRVAFETIDLDDVLSAVAYVKGLKIVLLDACRNNPFLEGMRLKGGNRAVSRGLAVPKEPDNGLLISYAAAAGTVASDGDGDHSPYAAALLKNMETPGLELAMMLRRVRADVKEATENRQTPFEYGSLPDREVYLVPPAAGQPAPKAEGAEVSALSTAYPRAAAPQDACRDAGTHWAAIRDKNSKAFYEEHLSLFGACAFASLARAEMARLAEESLAGAETACDRLAAGPDDPQRIASVAGLDLAAVDPAAAVPACKEATERFPGEARLFFQYGRSLAAGKDHPGALWQYRKAADLGSVAAMFAIGLQYDGGEGVGADPAEALAWYRKAAGLGHAMAMNNIGYFYDEGRGVAVDKAEAAVWYRRAADFGNALAMLNLGFLHAQGQGVARDDAAAMEWYRRSASLGNARAMNNIGYFYDEGRGVPVDKAAAADWYRRAADLGDPLAMVNLGRQYELGAGVAQDDAEALVWYRKGADLGNAMAMNNIGFFYDEGKGVPADKDQAMAWYVKSADLGNALAMFNVGTQYEFGDGVAQNDAQAFQWYVKASEAGHAGAMNKVGFFYDVGRGTTTDKDQAMAWYRRSAEGGESAGMFNVGVQYEYGDGVPQDYAEAMVWYRKAADLGHATAMNNIGFFYDEGRGVAADKAEAMTWYRKAADLGEALAMYNIGVQYEQGDGVAKDGGEAMRWYARSADGGNTSALRSIAVLYHNGDGVTQDYAEAARYVEQALRRGDEPTHQEMRDGQPWSPEFRRALQQRLRGAGQYQGAIDGRFGASTYAAMDGVFGADLR
ncbi:caspase family protein [Ensifer soli]|uniref:caspase family protein n=1 Tax=Ciceribacter sp. sgz301302 TaxID=3342379 RepID=UPI0035BA538C